MSEEMSDVTNQEEHENYMVEMEQRYAGMMDNLENCAELLENDELGRELYKRRIMKEFDSDSARDPSISPSLKKILKKAVEYDVDNVVDLSEMPAIKKKYKESRIYFENHKATKEEKEQFPDMVETDEAECERVMALFKGTFLGVSHTKNTNIQG